MPPTPPAPNIIIPIPPIPNDSTIPLPIHPLTFLSNIGFKAAESQKCFTFNPVPIRVPHSSAGSPTLPPVFDELEFEPLAFSLRPVSALALYGIVDAANADARRGGVT